ncbi:MAG: encapsulin-associated ferritin-like protein [Halothermotrichaceae bacterium]
MSEYHEPQEILSDEAVNYHRVIQSVKEELEAIGWYNQRADATEDESVKSIMMHNRNEEVEHAVMGIEWLRRHDSVWDEMLRTFLFSESDITDHHEDGEDGHHGSNPSNNSLGIGQNIKEL